MELEPIGFVKNGVSQANDENWGTVASEIRLSGGLGDGLRGLEGFSHAVRLLLKRGVTSLRVAPEESAFEAGRG